MCFLSVEKSCSPYSSKWFGSHALSNGPGYRQPSSTRSDCQTVSSSVPCCCRYDTRYVKRCTSLSNAVITCKEDVFSKLHLQSSNRYAQVYIRLIMDWHDNVNVCR